MSSFKDYILSFLQEHPDYQSILPRSPEELIQKNILVDFKTFQIESMIGQGSEGTVYKAKIPEENPLYPIFKKYNTTYYALKLICLPPSNVDTHEKILKSLQREISCQYKCNYPTILPLVALSFQVTEEASFLVIVTPLKMIDLRSLLEYCDNTYIASGLRRYYEMSEHFEAPIDVHLRSLCERFKIYQNRFYTIEKDIYLKSFYKLKLIFGLATGFAYIHKMKIAHRDIKPENILIDNELFLI